MISTGERLPVTEDQHFRTVARCVIILNSYHNWISYPHKNLNRGLQITQYLLFIKNSQQKKNVTTNCICLKSNAFKNFEFM